MYLVFVYEHAGATFACLCPTLPLTPIKCPHDTQNATSNTNDLSVYSVYNMPLPSIQGNAGEQIYPGTFFATTMIKSNRANHDTENRIQRETGLKGPHLKKNKMTSKRTKLTAAQQPTKTNKIAPTKYSLFKNKNSDALPHSSKTKHEKRHHEHHNQNTSTTKSGIFRFPIGMRAIRRASPPSRVPRFLGIQQRRHHKAHQARSRCFRSLRMRKKWNLTEKDTGERKVRHTYASLNYAGIVDLIAPEEQQGVLRR